MCSLVVSLPSPSPSASGLSSQSHPTTRGVRIRLPPFQSQGLPKPSSFPQCNNAFIRSCHRHTTLTVLRCSTGQAAADDGHFDSGSQPPQEQSSTTNAGFWGKWMANSAEMRAKVAKLGLAAVLAYGLFDGVTYTTFFILAFLGYEKSTGKNPAANLQALLGIVLLMWTGNNVTRPFRVAGAAALAPAIDKGLKSIQERLNLPSIVYAFALVAGIFGSACLTVAGLLILSRWGK